MNAYSCWYHWHGRAVATTFEVIRFDNTRSVLLLCVKPPLGCSALGHTPLKFFNFRPSEIVSDVISGMKEQGLLQIENLAIVLSLFSGLYAHTQRPGATILDVARV